MKNLLVISCGILSVSLPVAGNVMARSNILTGGLSLSYDYQDRRGDDGSIALGDSGNEDYQRVVVSPLIQIVSSSQRDRFELRLEPGVRYDLDESETDFDNDFLVAAERSISRTWQISGSNSFFRSDYNNSDNNEVESTDPELSPNLGRRRYWRNTLNLQSNYDYGDDSLFRIGGSWIALRNDDSGDEFNDYDRYSLTLRNEHRYSPRWKTNADLSVVRGDYDESDPTELSEDLYEYYLELELENNTIAQNPLFVTYDYIGVRYDEELQNYSDIHELRFSWRHDFSPQTYSVLGAGPSYEKTEGRDANWGGNGIAEINYQVRQGTYRFILEKGYEPENFSGTDEQAIVDFWDARFSLNRQLNRVLTVDGSLGYRYEDRTEQVSGTLSEEINRERYTAEIGLGYLFAQYFSARASYTFISQDSDEQADNYDDHRVLLTLSWEQDLLHW